MMLGVNCGSREIAARLPLGSVGVEIGVWRGDSSEMFLKRASHLHLVDPWAVTAYEGDSAYIDRYTGLVGSKDPKAFQALYNTVYEDVRERFRECPVTIHRCTSAQFFAEFLGTVDWVYIDGLHSFEGCLADLRGALRIVRGSIFGDDYGNKPGVMAAVDAFIAETGLTAEVFGGNQYEIRV
jgi:hypothetical protein